MSQISERQKKLVSIMIDLEQLKKEKDLSLIKLQKVVFLCEHHVKTCDISYSFRKSHFGPFSDEIVTDIEELERKGYVKLNNGNRIIISKTLSPHEKWENAETTVLEFNNKFPDNSSIIVSALSSPIVLNKSVGELIETAH